LSLAHCAQAGVSRCVSQTGVGAAQSAFVAQATHRPSRPHAFVAGVAAQSAFVAHCAHCDSAGLHFGAVAGHWESAVQPLRQRKPSGLQTGAAVPQSAFARHWTHVWSARLQRGAVAPQSVFAPHATQDEVVASQIGRVAGQSVFVLQPMQAPVAVLQMRASPCWHCAFVVQAGWHLWSPGKHAGAAVPQSVFVRQAPHCPVPAMQKGAVAGH
jgi:hypothetical protein